MAYGGASHDEAKGVDRIARVWDEDDVAGCGDRLRQIGEALFRSERNDNLACGIEFAPEAPRVIASASAAQPRNAARHGISMGLGILGCFDELGHDMRRGRTVGISHAEIDDIPPGCSRLSLQRIDLAEDVRGKALDAIEMLRHSVSAADGRPLLSLRALFGERYIERDDLLRGSAPDMVVTDKSGGRRARSRSPP